MCCSPYMNYTQTGDGNEFCKGAEESPEDKAKSDSTEFYASEASRFASNDTENEASYFYLYISNKRRYCMSTKT